MPPVDATFVASTSPNAAVPNPPMAVTMVPRPSIGIAIIAPLLRVLLDGDEWTSPESLQAPPYLGLHKMRRPELLAQPLRRLRARIDRHHVRIGRLEYRHPRFRRCRFQRGGRRSAHTRFTTGGHQESRHGLRRQTLGSPRPSNLTARPNGTQCCASAFRAAVVREMSRGSAL